MGVWQLLRRDLTIAFRQAADSLMVLVFFVLGTTLFPLGIGPDPGLLARIAPGAIWIVALLAAILPLDRLFTADFEDGSLDLLLLRGLHPVEVAGIRILSHWLTTGLPLLLMAAPAALMLDMPAVSVPHLLLGLLPGTIALSLLGGAAAALVIGARRGGILLPLLVLPLAVPVLIFGAAASGFGASGIAAGPALLLLSAFCCLALPLCLAAAGGALRVALS